MIKLSVQLNLFINLKRQKEEEKKVLLALRPQGWADSSIWTILGKRLGNPAQKENLRRGKKKVMHAHTPFPFDEVLLLCCEEWFLQHKLYLLSNLSSHNTWRIHPRETHEKKAIIAGMKEVPHLVIHQLMY